ncbi:hypothetical protein TruAng_000036 [Truncatella angustata]|nr:hypothetical protein TruAng_000036 [Truncatella angustata]
MPPTKTPPRAESCGTFGDDSRLPALGCFLDADPRPSFIVPINEIGPIPFSLSFCNEAFRKAGLEHDTLREANVSRQFRAWSQVVNHWRGEYNFAGRKWTAFKIQGHWKCIQSPGATELTDPKAAYSHLNALSALKGLEEAKLADARVASLHKMMEMSDVGTFEYSPQGSLVRANESWYRLSLHPKPSESHTDFSFMDLVYPPDGPLVLSKWNNLAQGTPVTFEMRWKGKNYEDPARGEGPGDYQWILSACVPIMDKDGKLISIAGNTIDITAQKQVQQEALQRAGALERARESEHKFARFALLAPIAIYICNGKGRMTYCNNRFFELTDHPSEDAFRNINWDSIVFPDDQAILHDQWKQLLHDKQHTQAHFRLKHTWDLGDGTLRQAWCESKAIPELDDEGNVVSIFGTLTDISRFKWADEIQKSRMEEALDAKHKHENFIDMTSHEMRNPLSAVIQCADSTIDSLNMVLSLIAKRLNQDALRSQIHNELKACLDSLNTIISCSIHQKRVIDDVLTLSKMDSNLLAIAPIKSEPAAIVAEAVHMFELECNKDSISLSFVEDPSLRETGAYFVMMDPSRVLQILINLLTNAIKFTRDRPTRSIEVSLGACWVRPSDRSNGFPYAKISTDATGLLDSSEWGNGREVFIWIKCRDTGCGMTRAEQSNLFTRFSQATPRTHIRYGGSGLGLFISKKLTELQGGAIGAKSDPDTGSTFAFFVATRMAPPPTPATKFETHTEHPFLLNRTWSSDSKVSASHNVEKAPQYSVLIVEDNLVNCTREIRNLQESGDIIKHIPIMAVSANARSEQIAQAREAGMDDAISKPFRIPELMPKIEALVNGDGPAMVLHSRTKLV